MRYTIIKFSVNYGVPYRAQYLSTSYILILVLLESVHFLAVTEPFSWRLNDIRVGRSEWWPPIIIAITCIVPLTHINAHAIHISPCSTGGAKISISSAIDTICWREWYVGANHCMSFCTPLDSQKRSTSNRWLEGSRVFVWVYWSWMGGVGMPGGVFICICMYVWYGC